MAATATERIRSSTYEVNGTTQEINSWIDEHKTDNDYPVMNYSVSWKTNSAETTYAVVSITQKRSRGN